MLGVLVETEDESIEFLVNAMEQSSAVAELCRNVDGTDYVVVVTPPELGDQKIFTYFKKAADQTFEAFSYAPSYQGEECYADVLATCAWPERVVGEVSLSLGEAVINAIVPNFCMYKDALKPGTKGKFRLSASINWLMVREPEDVKVDEGEMYEQALTEFLQNNPGKTKADFPGLFVSTEGAVGLFPHMGDSTSEFEIMSSVVSIEKTKINGVDICKVQAFLYRFDNDEYMINLYGTEDQLEGIEVGQEVVGVIRLYAEPVLED